MVLYLVIVIYLNYKSKYIYIIVKENSDEVLIVLVSFYNFEMFGRDKWFV